MQVNIVSLATHDLDIPGVGTIRAGEHRTVLVLDENWGLTRPNLDAAHIAGDLTFAIDVEERLELLESHGVPASELAFDNSTNGFAATNVQAAIEEIDTYLDGLTAESVDYDNDASALEATDVQGAIDEVVERVVALEEAPASKLTFDPTGTGLAATTVQAAIAEVNAAIPQLEDRVAALEGAPSNLGGALAASWSPSIDINSINGGSLTRDA